MTVPHQNTHPAAYANAPGPAHGPAVTIVIAAYNAAPTISRAIRSATAQSLSAVDIVVVDDCSTDSTVEIAQAFAARDPRVRIVRLPANSGGVGRPRNEGIRQAAAPYVMFLDADDELLPKAAETLLAVATRTGARITAGRAVRVETASGERETWAGGLYEEEAVFAGLRERPELLNDPIAAAKLYDRTFLLWNNVHFPEGVFYEDTFYSTKAYVLADVIALVPVPVYHWYWTKEPDEESGPSITRRTGELRSITDRIAVREYTARFLRECGALDVKARLDAKFLTHDLRLYMKALRAGDPEFRREFVEVVSGHIRTLEPAALETVSPIERVRAFFLMHNDVAGVMSTTDFGQRHSVAAGELHAEGDRVYWSGLHLHLPDARWYLDVTELGLHELPFSKLSLHNEAWTARLEGTRLLLGGHVINQFGRIAPGDPVRMTLSVRGRATRREMSFKVTDFSIGTARMRYRATIDLAEAIRRAGADNHVWNITLRVHWKKQSVSTALSVINLDLGRARMRVDGVDVELYETVSGNLAVRPVPEGADESGGPAADADRDWWRAQRPKVVRQVVARPPIAVVVAGHNVADRLEETLGSLAVQRRFASSQVILVDAGSTDATGKIMREFADRNPNVEVVREENHSEGNAANVGLARVTAPYVRFVRAGDVLGEESLNHLLTAARETNSLIVCGDSANGPAGADEPWRRYFGEGARSGVDLAAMPYLMFCDTVSHLLFSTQLLHRNGVWFGTGEFFTERWLATSAFLLASGHIAVVEETVCVRWRDPSARARSAGEWMQPRAHGEMLDLARFQLDLADHQRPRARRLLHRYVMRSLQPFVRNARKVLSDEQIAWIFPRLRELFARIPVDVVQQYATSRDSQVAHFAVLTGDFGLFRDPGTPPAGRALVGIDEEGPFHRASGTRADRVLRIGKPRAMLESLETEGGKLVFEGLMWLSGIDLTHRLENPLELVFRARGRNVTFPVEQVYRRDLWTTRNGRDLYGGWRAEVDPGRLAAAGADLTTVRLRVRDHERHTDCEVTARLMAHHYKGTRIAGRHRYAMLVGRHERVLFRMIGRSARARLRHARRRLREEAGWVLRRRAGWRTRLAYWLTYPLMHRQDIWIIGERSDTAQDNGYHLFRWIRQNRRRRKVYYVIDGDAGARAKIAPFGHVLDRGSFAHRARLLHAKKLISPYAQEAYLCPTGMDQKSYLHNFGDLQRYRRVFLQHGVTYNDVSRSAARQVTSNDMFLTVAEPERRYIAEELGYGDRARAIGFPRFDALRREHTATPRVLLMPTWRRDLVSPSYNQTLKAKKVFDQSAYFRFYSSLLADERLRDALSMYGVRLEFFPHYEILPHLHRFQVEHPMIEVAEPGVRDVQQAMKECDLMVTDYSSVFFDVAYMGTPVVYTAFDEDEFYSKHYRRGYFDLQRDGFGPVCRTVDQTVHEIIAVLDRRFAPDPEYAARVDRFFTHRDTNNCARVFAAIDAL